MHSFETWHFPFAKLNTLPEPLWKIGRNHSLKALWIRGRPEALKLLSRLPDDGLAIVGTRTPQARSRKLVESEVIKLRGSGLIIISGLARGVDAAAHEAALRAGLPTIGVLGCGLDVDYPPEHADLKTRILAAGGLIVSEFGERAEVYRGNFLHRNRVIAAWSRATWVVEAPLRSGALNTAKWARMLHKPVYATPCFPGEASHAGNQMLLASQPLQAEPFWSSGSLGSLWLSLAAALPESAPQLLIAHRSDPPSNDAQSVIRAVQMLSQEQSATTEQLIGWGLSIGWSVEQLIHSLERSVTDGWLVRTETGFQVSAQYR